jgi:hypothetical protein
MHEIPHLHRRAWHPRKDQHREPKGQPPYHPPSQHAAPHCLVWNIPQDLNWIHARLQQNQLHRKTNRQTYEHPPDPHRLLHPYRYQWNRMLEEHPCNHQLKHYK